MGWGIPLDIYADFNRIANSVLKGWWDVDAGVVLDGDEITAIADQSDDDNDATQGASVHRPTVVQYNGENVIQLGVNKYLEADGVSTYFNANDVPYTIFNYYLPDTLTGGTMFSLAGSGLSSSINSYFIAGYNNNGVRRDLRKEGIVESEAQGIVDITDSGAETNLVLLTERCDGTNVAFWRNGISDTGAGVPDEFSNPLSSQNKFTIGAVRRGASAATNFCRGKLKLQAVFNIDITDPERVWCQNAIFEGRFPWRQ